MEIRIEQLDKDYDHELIIHYINDVIERSSLPSSLIDMSVNIKIKDSSSTSRLYKNHGKLIYTKSTKYKPTKINKEILLTSDLSLENKLKKILVGLEEIISSDSVFNNMSLNI